MAVATCCIGQEESNMHNSTAEVHESGHVTRIPPAGNTGMFDGVRPDLLPPGGHRAMYGP